MKKIAANTKVFLVDPIQHINALVIHRHDMKHNRTLNKRKSSTENAKKRNEI